MSLVQIEKTPRGLLPEGWTQDVYDYIFGATPEEQLNRFALMIPAHTIGTFETGDPATNTALEYLKKIRDQNPELWRYLQMLTGQEKSDLIKKIPFRFFKQ